MRKGVALCNVAQRICVYAGICEAVRVYTCRCIGVCEAELAVKAGGDSLPGYI